MENIDFFFNPKSIAIVGASRSPSKIGHVIVRNFMDSNFRGKIYPVNPNAEELFGYKCYARVADIRDSIDLGIIAIPQPLVLRILEECGRKKIPAVIIVSSGFKEVGNARDEERIAAIARKYKMRVVGPNCLGVFDPGTGVDTLFLPRHKLERPEKGEIAFISQSGALGSVVLDWMAMKGYRVSKFVSYGNAADIDEADLIEYLANDHETKVICAYFEGVVDGRKFYETAKKTTKSKPIIVLKGGKTERGASATASHTGSLGGEARIYSAAFNQSGIIQAESLEQVFDFARVLSTQPMPSGKRVQIITDGGGYGVMAADAISETGLEFSQMKKESLEKIRRVSPHYVVLKNPIDLTGDATTERYRVAIDAALEDPNVDIILIIVLFQVPSLTTDVVDVIAEARDRRMKPIVVVSAGGDFSETLKKSLESFGVPCFSYPSQAASALLALYEHSTRVRPSKQPARK